MGRMSRAISTASNRYEVAEVGGVRFAETFKVPWKRVLLRWMRPELTLYGVYLRMGWTPGSAANRVRQPDLRLSIMLKMAEACEVPELRLGAFLADLANEWRDSHSPEGTEP